jgi:crotonobetainyl-CoA:carnitine CoA-transferase CaiB-like acyl-CoA transferase
MTEKNKGPLAGLCILDLSTIIAGPWAATLLADQGASVIKIEEPGNGDRARYVGSSRGGMSAIFHMANRGKRSIVINLKSPEGQQSIKALIARADVLIHNYRQSALDRLGIGYDVASGIKPDIIYCAITGFGDEGPLASHPAYDQIIQCYSGLASEQADPRTGEPALVRNIMADKLTALTAAQAISSALFARATSGRGQALRVSMLDAVISFLWLDAAADIALLDREDVRVGLPPAHQCVLYRFRNGWGTVAPGSDQAFKGMCRAFGIAGADNPRLASMPQRIAERALMGEIMQAWAAKATEMDIDKAISLLQAEDVPCAKVVDLADLPMMPQVEANKTFNICNHPEAGRIRETRPAATFSATPAKAGGPAPMLGQHTREILDEIRPLTDLK